MVKQYIRRILKTLLQFIIIIGLMLLIIYLTSRDSRDYGKLLTSKGAINMLYFLGFIALFYPMFAYTKKKVYLNHEFEKDRKSIEDIFAGAKYQLVKEEPGKLYFRPKSKLYRAMRLYEDTIVLDYTDNPIVFEGMRKDVYRLARYIERVVER